MKRSRNIGLRLLVACALASALPVIAIEPFTIKDIRVEGVQRTEAGTVFTYLPVKVGERIDDEKAAAAIKALYATGFYQDVRLERDGDVLIVSVQERPAICKHTPRPIHEAVHKRTADGIDLYVGLNHLKARLHARHERFQEDQEIFSRLFFRVCGKHRQV